MKDVFMVHMILPDYFSQKFYALVPKQKEMISRLMEQRVVLNYSMDMARKNLWVYINATDEKEVLDIIKAFPIIREVKIRIHELAFSDNAPAQIRDYILN